MAILNKTEGKIFLSLWIIYIIFAGFGGWNEKSLFALSLSMGIHNDLSINRYVNTTYFNTIDKLYINNNWYSPSTPGLSFISLPIIKILKIFLGEDIIQSEIKITLVIFFLVICTSGIASAGTSILIFKISKYFITKEKVRILLSITFGIGTSAFLYGTRYRSHATATFLSFLCFYFIFKSKYENVKLREFILAGIAGGLSVITDLPTLIILIPTTILFLSMKNNKKIKLGFFIGLIIPFCIFFIYNYIIFDNIFLPSPYMAYKYYPSWPNQEIIPLNFIMRIIFNFSINKFEYYFDSILIILRNIIQLLFLPYRGLFFYSPILLLSLFGFKKFFKNYKQISIFIILTLGGILFFTAGLNDWWCHGGGSCRRLLPFIPYLFIPIFIISEKIKFRYLVIISILSIFLNLLTIQPYENLGGWPYGINETRFRYTIVEFFDIIGNPLLGHYLPLFLLFGPDSSLLEKILNVNLFPFLNIIILFASLLIVWNIKIRIILKKHYKKSLLILLMIMLISLNAYQFRDYAKKKFIDYYFDHSIENNIETNQKITLLYPDTYYTYYNYYVKKFPFNIPYILTISDTNLTPINNLNRYWYIPNINNKVSMKNNASIYLYNKHLEKDIILKLILKSRIKNNKLTIFHNDHPILDINLPFNRVETIYQNITIYPGINKFIFNSNKDCIYLYKYIKDSKDLRCISLDFFEIFIYNQ